MANLGYLSGAPRVSTRPEAEASGPRAHVLGVMDAFRENSWKVQPYIVGDMVPPDWIAGSEKKLKASLAKRMAADVVRVAMSEWHARRAWKLHGAACDWVYERFGAHQMVGRHFKANGTPWIVETNGPFFQEAKTERSSIAFAAWARRRELWVYREADVLVTITQALKDIIVDASRVAPSKVLVVPNGVDTSRFDPCTVQARRLHSGPTIGFVGALIGWQALDLLLQAVASLASQDIFWNVTVVGDGPMRGEWEQRASDLGLAQRVVFLGQVPWSQVPALVAGFDLCYSGQTELQVGKMYHSPLKLYEYMAMAKPTVASAFEDARRVILPGDTGFLFGGGDAADLKLALTDAWQARDHWGAIGESARTLIVREHSWKRRVRDMILGIQEVLDCSKGEHDANG